MRDHYTARVVIEKVSFTKEERPASLVRGVAPKEVINRRHVEEVGNFTVKADSLEKAIRKVQGHVGLMGDLDNE